MRGLLESEGIRVVLQSRLAQSVYPFSVGDQAEVVLLVAAVDLPRADGAGAGAVIFITTPHRCPSPRERGRRWDYL